MNEKFYSLPEEKQRKIINAGYRVFSQNSYRKSPMSEIASEAGISKSLLFYYFRNKKELYLFLLQSCADVTREYVKKSRCYEQNDFFDIMLGGLRAKVQLMKFYPDLTAFSLKAYYEKDPEVCDEIQQIIGKYASFKANAPLLKMHSDSFRPGLDLVMIYKNMYWASEAYLLEKMRGGSIDTDEFEREFEEIIEFWKEAYLKKE